MDTISRFEMGFRDELGNGYMNRTYSSYSEYKSNYEESKLNYLIHTRYLKLLGKFIEDMFPKLEFDIFIRQRNLKEKKPDWFGGTYMELRIFNVIGQPTYNPSTFEPIYKVPHTDEYINGEIIYNIIDSFIPEINKHLTISFRPIVPPHIEIHNMDFYNIPDFECWSEYFKKKLMIKNNVSFFPSY